MSSRGRAGVLGALVLLLVLAWRAQQRPPAAGRAAPDPTPPAAAAAQGRTGHHEAPAPQGDGATGAVPSDAGPASVRDPAVRERIRAAIVRAWRAGALGAEPAAHAPIPPRAGSLPAEFIRGRIREDFVPMAGECYASLLRRRPGVGGRVVMEFEIVADANHGGLVEDARFVAGDGGVADAGLEEAEFLTCMRESMMTVAFLRPEGEGRVTVRYPFRLSPDDEDAGR